MASGLRVMRGRVRLSLYALALGSGALLAHLGGPPRPQASGTHPPAMMTFTAAALAAPLTPAPVSAASPALDPPPTQEPSAEARDGQRRDGYGDGLIIEGGTPHRLILFTFDDGPDRRTTPLLLDRLDAAGVKAVFFLTASRIAGTNTMEREQAALARETLARGHLVGSHTLDHLQLPLLEDAAVAAQVIGAEEVFRRALGFRPTLLRPPGGARSPRIDEMLAARHYTTVLWNLSTGDPQVHSAPEVFDTFRRVLERRERENGERGGIILLHDTYAWSVDAFQMILAELWSRNCRLLARGEELYDVVADLSFFYQPRAGAPASAVAKPGEVSPQVLAQRQARLRVETAARCNSADGF